ncbi:Nicotinic receptor-associated protein 1 [Trichostrongylus colubriformis]|uniref:Nicotinic receptor-associated protein 1 n=1 Tax=Trichostrongylus colubriformis TaxID=6319 RepID=A0AAN8FSE4_TRICO
MPFELPCARVFLSIKATGLKNRDVFSTSDPICTVSQLTKLPSGKQKWTRLGRTEVVWDSLDPEFVRKIPCDFFFEERQKLKFEIYDVDSKSSQLSKHDFLGFMECYLAEIVSVRSLTKELGGLAGKCGTITISAEEVDVDSVGDAEIHIRAQNLDRNFFACFSSPFLKIYRILEDHGRQLVYQSECVKHNKNPVWRLFRVNVQSLCGGDKKRQFVIECWAHRFIGRPSYIGECRISIDEIMEKRANPVPIINEDRMGKGDCWETYVNSGTLHFHHFQIVKRYTFLDFIQAGTQLDFSVAIDLTKSNGDPRKPDSLHYIGDPEKPSPYELAIKAVVDICQYYSRTQLFNAYGFGAIIPGHRKVSPIFNLNLSSSCVVRRLEGVLNAYHKCVPVVRLYGPTNFAPVIKEAARRASEVRDGSHYQIFLIITDGAISDMSSTKRAIINASYLPLSIIIVGVGDEDFSSMAELDSDDLLLSHEGRTAQRDIVQFVALRDFYCGAFEIENEHIMNMLAKEVLAEVPQQLSSYMERNSVMPMEALPKSRRTYIRDLEMFAQEPGAPPFPFLAESLEY